MQPLNLKPTADMPRELTNTVITRSRETASKSAANGLAARPWHAWAIRPSLDASVRQAVSFELRQGAQVYF